MSIKISAAMVVTVNGRMDVWQPGYLIVQDGQIVEAGPGHGPDGSFDETEHFPRHRHARAGQRPRAFAIEPPQGPMGTVATGNLAPIYPRRLA